MAPPEPDNLESVRDTSGSGPAQQNLQATTPPFIHDVTGLLLQLTDLVNSQKHPILAPNEIKHHIEGVLDYFKQKATPLNSERRPGPLPVPPSQRPSHSPQANQQHSPSPDEDRPTVEENFKLNRTTTLKRLYRYNTPNAIVQFPESGTDRPIGYLFAMDQNNWTNPTLNFVYSGGEPRGMKTTDNGKPITNKLLVDEDGEEVPCRIISSTCQGVKVCPFVDMNRAKAPHIEASREQLAERLKAINAVRRRESAPKKEIFLKTFEYFAALKRRGCGAPPFETTVFSEAETVEEEEREERREKERRGHSGQPTCKGRLLLEYTVERKMIIRCEHYNRRSNVDHFIDYNAGAGLLDAEYLEALFFNNREVLKELEEDVAATSNIGPRSPCSLVSNVSTIKTNCSFTHRTSDGRLENPELQHLTCDVKFRIYEPLQEYRSKCPWALVTCKGEHTHPIPIPSKTPPAIRSEIFTIIYSLKDDLPDLTPRRFLRHPSLKAYLQNRLPKTISPTLLDLHPSLANRDHLRAFIGQIQKEVYPEGTGWEGLLYQKKIEEELLKEEDRYVRFAEELAVSGPDFESDDPEDDSAIPLRIVICMLKENSTRLLNAHYIQSDIGFKRVAGFKEFELGGLDDGSRKSITYCRIFLNRQSAEAHRMIFNRIDDIVLRDTGERLKWRHIHSDTLDIEDAVGIFQLAVDQHGGQAKGAGLYLRDVARRLPVKPDLHEPHLNIQDLNEYDHLRRILRLCKNHFIRNVQKCAVPDDVKKKMLSLLCMEHPSWDDTLAEIIRNGGKAREDWVADKIRSKFALPGVCWEKSYIPREIWQAGEDTTNIIESLHEDVNREGLSCTLLGGIQKGRHFDLLKDRTLKNLECTGVQPSYRIGSLGESTLRSLQRKGQIRHKIFEKQDKALIVQNSKLEKAHESKLKASYDLEKKITEGGTIAVVEKAVRRKEKAEHQFEQALSSSIAHKGTGSGKVGLLLPSNPELFSRS